MPKFSVDRLKYSTAAGRCPRSACRTGCPCKNTEAPGRFRHPRAGAPAAPRRTRSPCSATFRPMALRQGARQAAVMLRLRARHVSKAAISGWRLAPGRRCVQIVLESQCLGLICARFGRQSRVCGFGSGEHNRGSRRLVRFRHGRALCDSVVRIGSRRQVR